MMNLNENYEFKLSPARRATRNIKECIQSCSSAIENTNSNQNEAAITSLSFSKPQAKI
jgi:hypothetical protein